MPQGDPQQKASLKPTQKNITKTENPGEVIGCNFQSYQLDLNVQ